MSEATDNDPADGTEETEDPLPPSSLPLDEPADPAAEAAAINTIILRVVAGAAALLILKRILK